MQFIKTKNIIILFVLILALTAGVYAVKQSSKSYIGGNVFHAPYIPFSPRGYASLPTWINNGIYTYLLFDTLLLASHDLTKFSPVLAEKYDILDNGLTYRFTLRKNLFWSDGSPLTPEDIAYSIELTKKLEDHRRVYDDALSKIIQVSTDENSISITLNDMQPGFLFAMSQLLIIPKHAIDNNDIEGSLATYWKKPITSGMYTFVEENDSHIRLENNPYNDRRVPKIETILIEKDPYYQNDVYLAADIAGMEDMRSIRDFTTHTLPIQFYRYYIYNIVDNPAMQDKNVRVAIAKAIDNEAILQALYANIGTSITVLTDHEYNLSEAKTLVQNSSYPIERPLRIGYYFNDNNSIYFVQVMGEYLKAAGFAVEYIREDSIEDHYKNKNFDILVKDKTIVRGSDWYAEHHSSHPSAQLFGTKGRFDVQIQLLLQTLDATRLKEIAASLDPLLIEGLYRYPIISLHQAIYTNNLRVKTPSNAKFGNPWYITDGQFENWEILKK